MNNKKITKLNVDSKFNTLENIRDYKRRKKIRRRLTIMSVFALLLIVSATLPILKNIRVANEYDAQAKVLEEELSTIESKKDELEYEVTLLEDDEYIAKLARKELNLSRPNEILINLPEDEEDETDETEEVKTSSTSKKNE